MERPHLMFDSAFKILNEGRAKLGKPAFLWEGRLYAIAQELADHAWSQYQAGRLSFKDAHWEFLERGARHGWTDRLDVHPPDAPRGTGNRGEYGVSGQSDGDAPRDLDGWRHPVRSVDELVRDAVSILTGNQLKYNEGHRVDFRISWTHAAIGYTGGIAIIEYGFLNEPNPKPGPTPTPDSEISFY
jgi:hypothetical protein